MANGNNDYAPTGTIFTTPAPTATPTDPSVPVGTDVQPAPTGTIFQPGAGIPITKLVGQPDPDPTWWDWAGHKAALLPRALEANPVDVGANLANYVTSKAGAALGYQPAPIAPPVGTIEDWAGVPTPQTRGDVALVGAAALPVGGLFEAAAFPQTGLKYATALRQIPPQALIGGTGAAVGYGLPPEAQIPINLALSHVGNYVLPGMATGSDLNSQMLRNEALKGGIEIPTAAVAPSPARTVYSATGIAGTGAGPAADKIGTQWVDKTARDMGADYSVDGRLTGDVFNQAQAKFGGLYNQVAAGARAVPMTSGTDFSNGVGQLHAAMMARPPGGPGVANLIDDLLDAGYTNKTNPGMIPGAVAVKMLQGGSQLDQIIRNPADNVELGYAKQLKTVLDNATRGIQSSNLLSKWDQADEYYKNYQTNFDATDHTTGHITPESLTDATNAAVRAGYLPSGGGTPGLNSRIGTTFQITPPASNAGAPPGASWRTLMHGAGPLAGAGAAELYEAAQGGGLLAHPYAAALAGLAGYGIGNVGQRIMRGVSGGPNPPPVAAYPWSPGGLAYASRLLANPGQYVMPGMGQQNQQGQ